MSSLDNFNARLIDELLPSKRWAAHAWYDACSKAGHKLAILKGYETHDEHLRRFAIGRTHDDLNSLERQGLLDSDTKDALMGYITYTTMIKPIVTNDLHSKHTARLALDVKPMNCSYTQIATLAQQYGVTQPHTSKPWHFDFSNARSKPVTTFLTRLLCLLHSLFRRG